MARTLLVCLCCSFISGSVLCSFDEDDGLDGTWIVSSAQINGKPAHELKGLKVLFSDKSVIIKARGGQEEKGTIKVFPKMKPCGIDIMNQSGGVFSGILKLNGDTVEICQSLRN